MRTRTTVAKSGDTARVLSLLRGLEWADETLGPRSDDNILEVHAAIEVFREFVM